jgi:lipid II:glycine glycyltransferase (peptidoglycan interpeptide bridge formation enzyme)
MPTTSPYGATSFKPERSPAVWQQTLAKLPFAHALQSWVWGQFKGRWGWTALPQTMAIGGNHAESVAAALVLKRRLPGTPFCVLYVPKGPVLDYRNTQLRERVLGQLEQLARRERAIFIKIDPEVVKSWGVEEERVAPLGTQVMATLRGRGWVVSAEQIQFRNTVELYLDQTEEQLLAAMKQKTRYNIRLAGRKDVTVRQGTRDDLPMIFEMYRDTAARDGFTIRPEAYYLDGWGALYDAGMAQPLIAEVAGRPIAAVILVRYGDRAIYMYGASSNEERDRMPNYLLQWEAIRWARSAGCTVYDMWGAPDHFDESDRMWGVWRFKAGFNGEVVRFIGAWDYPVWSWAYRLYTDLVPRYLNLLRGRGPGQTDSAA